MKLFLDTEFTDFIDSELISIGIVDENGREFYAEITDFPRERCSDFVNATVIPLLGQYSDTVTGPADLVAHRLVDWLEEYRVGGATVSIDYATDWHLFLDLLSLVPKDYDHSFITGQMIWTDLDHQLIEEWWSETKLPRHMALYDARANRHGYDPENGY